MAIIIEGRMGGLGSSSCGGRFLLLGHHRGEIYLHEGGAAGLTSSKEEAMTVNSSASLRVSILFPLAHVIIITPLLPFNLNTKFYSILQLLSTNLTLPYLYHYQYSHKSLSYHWFLSLRAREAEIRE